MRTQTRPQAHTCSAATFSVRDRSTPTGSDPITVHFTMASEAPPVRLKLSTFQYAANDPCEARTSRMSPQMRFNAHLCCDRFDQDTLVVQHDEAGLYVGIFDGHGGDPVSQLARREAHNFFKMRLEEHNGDVEHALHDSLLDLDAEHLAGVTLSHCVCATKNCCQFRCHPPGKHGSEDTFARSKK